MSVYSNWKYFFDSFWKFVSRNSYPIVLVLFFIWICIGIFPLTCIIRKSKFPKNPKRSV